ncbi:MAG: membrane protein insertase YidC [Lachnospiraceae bacterium]|nr:membrane protein insertase YidC [Lachnospiraceae bacterium]
MALLGGALGIIMYVCYLVTGNYGISIILFTLITKIILFPVGLLTQRNSIRMVKLMPENNALKIKYADDKDKLADEQLALYKKYHYNPFLGVVPLLLQIPLVLGLVYVIYHPLNYVLHLDQNVVLQLKEWIRSISSNAVEENSYQNDILMQIKEGIVPSSQALVGAVSKIRGFGTNFLGMNLSHTPSFRKEQILLIIPFLSGISAWIMCVVQNRINVLQVTQGKTLKYLTTIFMVAFSTYFAFLVPVGVGLYWIFGNLFAIPSMWLLNVVMPPKKYVDYNYLQLMKSQREENDLIHKKNRNREKADYKRFIKEDNKEIVVYSERNGFYKFFSDIIQYLIEHSDVKIHYVTSDPQDERFSESSDQLIPYYVASDRYLIPLFMRLECKICLMTVPDLEKYHIKRSRVKKDIEYIFVCHGIGSTTLTFRKGALDWFDTLFCPGPDNFAEVREEEELYGTPRKRLIKAGYPLIDNLIKQYNELPRQTKAKPAIVIAPSWQPNNIIDVCIEPLIDSLCRLDCDIIVRPHPQQVRHEPEKFVTLQEKYKDRENVEFQMDFSATFPLATMDLLVTDWSDICWEFALSTLKPVLFIDTPMKVINPEYDKIKTVPINITLRNVIGKSIAVENINEAATVARELLDRQEEYHDIISSTRSERLYNIGMSAKISAVYIQKSLKGEL